MSKQFSSRLNPMFRSQFSEDIFTHKYSHKLCETWEQLAHTLVEDVCQSNLSQEDKRDLKELIRELKFIPAGRYLYYAGRPKKFFSNCYLLSALEDSREDWGELSRKAELCLMCGGGIGVDYSTYRASDVALASTGGQASGPLPKIEMINEIGRRVMQGASRRSAIYASLNWKHSDAQKFLTSKNWHEMKVAGTDKTIADLKRADFNYQAPLDLTNISINYDTSWLKDFFAGKGLGEIFLSNVRQAMSTSEPGFSFNFFDKESETLRNACTEITSSDDSDVCNLGSINLGRIESLDEMFTATELGTKFLICGGMRADMPYPKVGAVRNSNRRIGLGLMGLHEWLLKNHYKYEVNNHLLQYLEIYRGHSDKIANEFSDQKSLARPKGRRAIAPTGTIGILAGTSTGIEPIFAVAYKRRYLKGTRWHYQHVVDSTAEELHRTYDIKPDNIESALDLAKDYKRRIAFQAEVQKYVDQAISSTINLPPWGTEHNNEDMVEEFSHTLALHATNLRGFTCYSDGSRGGQPLVPIPYDEAVDKLGTEFEEHVETHDVCNITGSGGSCGS